MASASFSGFTAFASDLRIGHLFLRRLDISYWCVARDPRTASRHDDADRSGNRNSLSLQHRRCPWSPRETSFLGALNVNYCNVTWSLDGNASSTRSSGGAQGTFQPFARYSRNYTGWEAPDYSTIGASRGRSYPCAAR